MSLMSACRISHLCMPRSYMDMQVSAFGSDTQSDGGDVWLIEWDGKGKIWKQNTKVIRLPYRRVPSRTVFILSLICLQSY